MTARINATEMNVAERVGKRIAGRWSSVDADDVVSHLYLWILENTGSIIRWRDEEGGEGKLYVSLRREAAKFCAAEEAVAVGRPLNADNFYNPEMLERALPFVFEDVPQTVAFENPVTGGVESRWSPGDSNNAVAIITDIRSALYDLNFEIRETIELRFRDGLTFEEIGELAGISKVGAKKRVDRAVQRLCDSLG